VPWLASLLLMASGLVHLGFSHPPSAAERCGIDLAALNAPSISGAPTMMTWGSGTLEDCWNSYLPWQAAQRLKARTGRTINVRPVALEAHVGVLDEEFMNAMRAGRAPDISYVGHDIMFAAAQGGYIEPLDTCFSEHDLFRRFHPYFLNSVRRDGHVWGLPVDTSFEVLFFNKILLRKMGWAEADIAALPDQIASGRFLMSDLLATAKRAVQRGVVGPGFGFWPTSYPDWNVMTFYLSQGAQWESAKAFVLDKASLTGALRIWRELFDAHLTLDAYQDMPRGTGLSVPRRDPLMSDQVLFWQDGVSQWGVWATNKVPQLGGTHYLDEHIGVALLPSAIAGKPGFIYSSGKPSVYVIPSTKATGRPVDMATACAVLAEVATPDIVLRTSITHGSPSPLSGDEQFADRPDVQYVRRVTAMLDRVADVPGSDDFARIKEGLIHAATLTTTGRTPEDIAEETAAWLTQVSSGRIVIR